jgi:uncharacterized protein YjbI with pentapeptide repeats
MHWFSACDPLSPFDDRQTRASAVAEIDHVSLLRQGTEAWNAWREANPAIRQDLHEANLCRANLSDAMLNGSNLSGAYLSGAVLSRANLRGTTSARPI